MIRLREFAGIAAAAMLAMTLAATLAAADEVPFAGPTAPQIRKPVLRAVTAPVVPKPSTPHVIPAKPAAAPVAGKKPQSRAPSHLPDDTRPAPALAPGPVTPAAGLTPEAAAVAARLQLRVPPALTPYFNLFLYVSKAASGPWAQHLFVFHKDAAGRLVFERSFPVSTGREREEAYFTTTPTGIFELDPDRFYKLAHSGRWHGAPMPHAMFLNYSYRTQMSGVALHAATGHLVDRLGSRASGGCVRLPPDRAAALFARIKREERGPVPVLAFDKARGTTNVRGQIARDARGEPLLAPGFRVLLVISDASGEAA